MLTTNSTTAACLLQLLSRAEPSLVAWVISCWRLAAASNADLIVKGNDLFWPSCRRRSIVCPKVNGRVDQCFFAALR